MDTELANKITPVHPAIEFDCVVSGRALIATITHIEESIVGSFYHVLFSDGHKGQYTAGDDGHDEAFGRTRELDEYEEAVYEDLCVIPGLEEDGRYTYIRVQVKRDGSAFNVWVRPEKQAAHFSVYYHGEYQFSLRRNGTWETNTQREKGYVIDREMASLVSKHLDLHS